MSAADILFWSITGAIIWLGIRILARAVSDEIRHRRWLKDMKRRVMNDLADDWYVSAGEEDGIE